MSALRCSEHDNLSRFESGFLHRDNSHLCLTNDAGVKDTVGLKSLYLFGFKCSTIIPKCFDRLFGSEIARESCLSFMSCFILCLCSRYMVRENSVPF